MAGATAETAIRSRAAVHRCPSLPIAAYRLAGMSYLRDKEVVVPARAFAFIACPLNQH